MTDSIHQDGFWHRLNTLLGSLPILLQAPLIFGAVGIVVGLGFALVAAIGSASAIGPQAAWELYGSSWVRAPLFGLAGGIGFGVFLYTLLLGIEPLDKLMRRLRPALGLRITMTLLVTLLVLGIGSQIAYRTAAERYAHLSPTGRRDGRGVEKLLDTQRSALTSLSSNAQRLLAELNATEADVQTARSRLSATLLALQQQQIAVDSSSATLQEIDQRQAVLQSQFADIQRALGGQEPITRADLERSQRWGWIQGGVLGVLTSMAAAFLLRGLGRVPFPWRRSMRR